jgi:hypothetical protein
MLGYIKDIVYKSPWLRSENWSPELLLPYKELCCKFWTMVGTKVNATWTNYVPRKALRLKLTFCNFYSTLLSYCFIYHKQFHFVVFSLKIMGYKICNNNLESPDRGRWWLSQNEKCSYTSLQTCYTT